MVTGITIASVVEGHGEVEAVPILLRRIAGEIHGRFDVATPKSHRAKRSRIWQTDDWTRAVRMQSLRVTGSGGVLVVVDADDDCAVEMSRKLAEHCDPARLEVAVAVREFEAWFLAGAESLRSHRLVRDDAEYEGDPETKSGAKEALESLMYEPYRETLHQAAFASLLDLAAAQRARSFRHLVDAVGRLIDASSPEALPDLNSPDGSPHA